MRDVAVAIRPQRKKHRGRKKRRGASRRARGLWAVRGLAWRVLRRALPLAQLFAFVVVVVTVWLTLNWTYQVVRKPSELFFPVSRALYKTPEQTWRTYGPLFRRHSTDVITAPFLGALAQVEGAGNPIVRTYWRWSVMRRPFEVYRPASSAVGMYQITDGTFAEARRYCIRRHAVVEDGPWYSLRSCWFNALYTRVVPSHAVELTSAHLHRHTTGILAQQGLAAATATEQQALAAVIHLCGAGAGADYARRGLQPAGQRCGDHDVAAYVAKVSALQRLFTQLAAAEQTSG